MGDPPRVRAHTGADFEGRGLHPERRGADPTRGETTTDGWDDEEDEEDSNIGLMQRRPGTSGKAKVRGAAQQLPARMGKVWATVTVQMNEKAYTTNPNLQCNECGKAFSGGVGRIKAHICSQCPCSTPELQTLRAELKAEAERAAEVSARNCACSRRSTERQQESSRAQSCRSSRSARLKAACYPPVNT